MSLGIMGREKERLGPPEGATTHLDDQRRNRLPTGPTAVSAHPWAQWGVHLLVDPST